MIIVLDRDLGIPPEDIFVAFTGDNQVENRQFQLDRYYNGIDLSVFDFKLDTQIGETKNIIDLEKVISGDTIFLTWEIKESHVLTAGEMAIQIRAFSGTEQKWHSTQDYVVVKESINASATIPDPLPSEFEQMEVRVTTAKNEAQEAEQGALGQANRAQGIADTFENTTLPAAIQSVGQAVEEQIGIAKGHADRAQGIADTFSNTTLPVAISAVEAAGQAKVDLAEQQVERVEDIIQEAEQDVLPELRQAIEDGIETKGQLGGSIQEAGEAKTALDGSISAAGPAKTGLDGSISSAGVAKTQLDGSISSANGIKSQLDGSITAAGQVKELLDESIATGDLDSFKADYMQFKNDSTLESAKIEKEFNDYKATLAGMNPNQEATQSVNGYGIIPLPKNAANGQVSDVVIKGLTATNLVENGNFSKGEGGLGGWLFVSASGHATNNILFLTATKAVGGAKYNFINYSALAGHKLYIQGKIKSSSIGAQLFCSDGISGLTFPYSGSNNFEVVSGIKVFDNSPTNISQVAVRDNSLSDWTEIQAKEIFAIDLTATFGVGNEPTKEECDKIFANYFDGTKSTNSVRVKSVGKNLFDGELEPGSIVNTTGVEAASPIIIRSKNFIKATPNTQYSSSSPDVDVCVHLYDINKNWTRYVSTTTPFTTNANEYFIKFRTSSGQNDLQSKVQIEPGTTATEYEPYKESSAYINGAGELRSLPNGTKDEINLTTGVKTQRVSDEYILNGSESWLNRMSNVTDDGVHAIFSFAPSLINFDQTSPSFSNNVLPNTGVVSSLVAAYSRGEGVCLLSAGTTLYITITKNKLATQDSLGLKSWLQANPITLTYQLATPIVTPIQTSGSLVSYPSGTVYIEPFVADAGIYTDKMEVLYSDLPIKALEKISKVDFDTGLETELDITAAVIAEDKLSFTHPDLTSGDIVFFVYEHGAEGTIPETEISYYDSRYVIKGEDDKFYRWEIEAKLVEGVITPSIKLVEV